MEKQETNVGFINFDKMDFKGLESIQILRHIITGTDDNLEIENELTNPDEMFIQDVGCIRNVFVCYNSSARINSNAIFKRNPDCIRFYRFAVVLKYQNGSKISCEEPDGTLADVSRYNFDLKHFLADTHVAKLCTGESGRVVITGEYGKSMTIRAIDNETIIIDY